MKGPPNRPSSSGASGANQPGCCWGWFAMRVGKKPKYVEAYFLLAGDSAEAVFPVGPVNVSKSGYDPR
eukprot:4737603-Amphidinium_carterae.1